ncbi:MAG TPA: type 2 lanthipeptide synthetase LanM family protein [Gemmatimonadaceae bacterium]|nr:type 2 lanthipeptide synthetase LanM family protein [Gemmatimonadaceae bacterium]
MADSSVQRGSAPARTDPDITARTTMWCSTVARGDEDAFARRLAWDGLTVDQVHRALADDSDVRGSWPTWAETFDQAYGQTADALRSAFARARHVPSDVHSADAHLAFEELFAPLLRVAAERVRTASGAAYACFERPAHAALERALLISLARIGQRTLWASYQTFRASRPADALATLFAPAPAGQVPAVYDAFLEQQRNGGLLRTFAEYPVLARLAASAVDRWVQGTVELLERAAMDAPRLQDVFGGGTPLGTVVAAQTGLSDPHNGGRSVVILTWASGTRVVYKPRAVDLDACYAELLEWLNAHGACGAPRLRPMRILPGAGYGWLEFIASEPCADADGIERFYERCGSLLCLVYALNGTDFHFENLLASGEYPMLLDLEMLLAHRFELVGKIPDSSQAAHAARRAWSASVLNVGMLPTLKPAPDGAMFEVGGLVTTIATDDTTGAARSAMAGSAQPRASGEAPSNNARNVPWLGGQRVGAGAYVEAVTRGFGAMYDTLVSARDELLAEGGVLDRMRRHPVRFILRNTSLYTALLQRCTHPQYLRDGIERSIQLDVLAKTFLVLDDRPTVWPTIAEECRALEEMDVPFFAAPAESRRLPLSAGAIEQCFQASAYEEMLLRMRHLGDADRSRQIGLIRGAFLAMAQRDVRVCTRTHEDACVGSVETTDRMSEPLNAGEALEEALAIAHRLHRRAIETGVDAASWIGMSYVAPARRYVLSPMSYCYFDGYSGLALFLAAVERASGGAGLRDFALSAVAPLADKLDDFERVLRLRRRTEVGAGSGIAAGAYGLAAVSRLLSAPTLMDAAMRIASCMEPRPDRDTVRTDLHDVLSGSAGAVLVLLALYDATGAPMLRDRAVAFGEQLLAARVADDTTGCRVWASAHGVVETGFAHGQAGIAYALERLAAATHDSAFHDAAVEAIIYERHVLGADLSGAAAEERVAAWSRGATGIGLARLGGSRTSDDAAARADITAALAVSRGAMLDGVDSLCCGTAARIDLFVTAAELLSDPGLALEARRAAAQLVERARYRGSYELGWRESDSWQAGLFHGVAGVGYTLLRATMPALLPSPLLWR